TTTGSRRRAGRSWPPSARTGAGSSPPWAWWRGSSRREVPGVNERRPAIDWPEIVARHARSAGAPELPERAVEELAAHLDEIHRAALRQGASEEDARQRALAALREAPLAGLEPSRRPSRRLPSLPVLSPWQALGAAFRQFRSHRRFAAIAVLVLGLGTGA